ncbi:MAG: hypothetical protein AUH05_20985 [Ktedonobacter sp. 13_2_20CM_53_11]|nr:MAG: hypothetical protein AUH05_20985 [Ktedonobacter sp. 13_2_20CM_53_11]
MFHVKHCDSFSNCYIIDVICMAGKAGQGSPFACKYFVIPPGKTIRTHLRGSLSRSFPMERSPVILSAAKDLARLTERSFAALRMTGLAPLKPAHGKPSLQISKLLLISLFLMCTICYTFRYS